MTKQGLAGRLAHDLTHRGVSAWILCALLTGFYCVLYFTEGFTGPAKALGLDSKWTLYGLIYTIAIVSGGLYVIRKYKHNRYQIVRTAVVMFCQSVLAFALPHILAWAKQPEFYFSYLWPLKIEYFYPSTIFKMPLPFILWSFIGSAVLVPVLALRYGKRWYCSWVCGCGGLANTAGDPFRQLSSKSLGAWKLEKITIHTVLALSIIVTVVVAAASLMPNKTPEFARFAGTLRSLYALYVSSILSGVVGVGLYPIGGTRIWCRYACPMAAMLGLMQKAGRFRIRVKRDMCISCGMCSNYCEMGIDVRSYAQANRDFTRASCVGCGLCAEVCPRGVLSLESTARRDPQEKLQLVQIRLPGTAHRS